jgi:two-component system, NarL family, sensor histidine kinase DegS
MVTPDDQSNITLEDGLQLLNNEMSETERALREVTLMLEQSQGEVAKLAQRNAGVTTHLQQLQANMDTVPVAELKMAYDSALDVQQRLLVMRGQIEKLQNDQAHLQKYKDFLGKAYAAMTNTNAEAIAGAAKTTVSAGIESIINAQESERQRLSRQMHDGPAQALSNFILQTEIAMRLLDADPAQAKAELMNLKAAAMSTFQKVRNFIFELRPMMLDDLGVAPTVKRYAETFKEQNNLEVNVMVTGSERRLESYIEVLIFRSLQELLGNASRHSQATLVKVHMDMGESLVKVSVDDNGRGFDVGILTQGNSMGLNVIRDRVDMVGGNFEVESTIGKGTRIVFTLPARPAA